MSTNNEELALPMNGKNSKLKRNDFSAFAESLEINATSVAKIHKKISANASMMYEMIAKNFISILVKKRVYQFAGGNE